MDLDPVLEQGPQPTQTRPAPRVAQHRRANRRVRGMNRDVQRSEPLLDHPGEVEFGEAGQCREVAVEERESVIIILQI